MQTLDAIVQNFRKQEIEPHISLSPRLSLLIQAVCLCSVGGEEDIKELVQDIGEEKRHVVRSALYQCVPYIGSPAVHKIVKQIEDTETYVPQSIEQRFANGYELRKTIFGKDATEKNVEEANPKVAHIQRYLCSYCFGDFYTDAQISIQERELLTFCILISLGGCEAQVQAHIKGNCNVGNDVTILLDALTLCLPYIGFPKTLNAISLMNKMDLL